MTSTRSFTEHPRAEAKARAVSGCQVVEISDSIVLDAALGRSRLDGRAAPPASTMLERTAQALEGVYLEKR